MPSLNLSSPGLPGLAAGLFPVASNQLPQVNLGSGSDFAAIMAPPDGAPTPTIASFLDAAPVLPPGTALPPVRQDIAGSPQPIPDIPVENVMLGALPPPAAAEEAPTAQPAANPSAQPQIGECRVETSDFNVASRRAAARANLLPATPQPAVATPVSAPELEPDKAAAPGEAAVPAMSLTPPPAEADAPAEKAAEPEQPRDDTPAVATTPQPAPPPFAPVDWTRQPAPAPAPALKPESGEADVKSDAPRSISVAASLPAPAGPSVKPGPDAISTLPRQPDGQTGQPQVGQQPQQPAQSQPQTALPGSFNLPPEIAREIAQVVRAAVGERDDSARRATDSADPVSALPPPQTAPAPAPAAPLHREFVAANKPVIDTSRAEWMQAMIERIAEMPSADGKRGAQIRLSPDALGAIDVRIEQRQDRLHVTMNADSAQARQLLTDAAPRLQEMAEARGLRLGQTGIGGGESQDRRHTQEQQEPKGPLRPRPAEAVADTSSQTDGDLIA